ncbi:MAG: TIGR04282 family arsenosugar biosynthesis glycosyltransferase [bacterium]
MIQIFARAPEAGKVKTRLIPALGEAGALGLYLALARQTLSSVCELTDRARELWLAGDEQSTDLDSLVMGASWTIVQQRGSDLGERMYLAAVRALASHPYTIIIGTDCPAMSSGYIQTAIDALESGARVVLGPAEDGGYVLIGLSETHPTLFTELFWGTETVLQDTCQRLDLMGWEYQLLDMVWDVDRPADLVRLRREYPALMPG